MTSSFMYLSSTNNFWKKKKRISVKLCEYHDTKTHQALAPSDFLPSILRWLGHGLQGTNRCSIACRDLYLCSHHNVRTDSGVQPAPIHYVP
jgi:hypothetical protein